MDNAQGIGPRRNLAKVGVYVAVIVVGALFAGRELYRFYRLQTHPQPDVLMAVVRANTDELEELLRLGADENKANSRGETALHLALGSFLAPDERVAMVRLLLDYGADPNAQDDHGNTPIQRALMIGRENAAPGEIEAHLRTLIEAGADVNQRNSDGVAPLARALMAGLDNAQDLLLANGAEVTLVEAVLLQDTGRVAQFIREDPMAINSGLGDWTTPLMFALEIPDYDIAQMLIDAGASFSVQNKDGLTPFHILVSRRGHDWDTVMAYMREYEMEPNVMTRRRQTPLMFACRAAPPRVVEQILAMGADVNAANADGNTPLMLSVLRPDEHRSEIVRLLLEAGADPEIRNAIGSAALHLALSADAIQLLLEYGADPNVSGRFGVRPLERLSVRWSVGDEVHADAIRLLLENGADPEGSGFGESPLSIAVRAGNLELAALLIEHGADPDRAPEGFESPRTVATEIEARPFLELFNKAATSTAS